MTELDYLEALKAIRTCVQKPNYRVGIVMRSMQEVQCVYTDIANAILEDEEEKQAARTADTQLRSRIAFNNGSTIQFVRASENAKGCRFNHVLYGQGIDPNILYDIILHTEFRYKEGAI